MLKRITFISLLLLFATAAFAHTDEAGNSNDTLQIFKPSEVTATPQQWGSYIDTQTYQAKDDFNQFYIELGGGLDLNTIELKQHTAKSRLGANGPNANLTLGFGGKFDNLYLGLAADGSLDWAESKYSTVTGLDRKIKLPYSIGAYLVPGVFLSHKNLLYLKLGGVNSELKTHYSPEQAFNANSFSKHIWGFRGGLGLRYYFNKYFSINGEYVFTYYPDVKDTYNGYESKYSILTNQFNIGIGFHF